jgi:hypothetical protein
MSQAARHNRSVALHGIKRFCGVTGKVGTVIREGRGDATPVDEDSFIDEVVQSDASTNELKSLGFTQIACEGHTVKLHDASDRPATGARELDIEPRG